MLQCLSQRPCTFESHQPPQLFAQCGLSLKLYALYALCNPGAASSLPLGASAPGLQHPTVEVAPILRQGTLQVEWTMQVGSPVRPTLFQRQGPTG